VTSKALEDRIMTATTTSVRPERSPRLRLVWIVPVVIALAVVVLAVNLSTALPARQRLTVRNETGAPVTIHATGDDGGRLGLGTVDGRSGAEFDAVIDQGAVWRFRISVGPATIGTLRRTDDQLEAAGWRITIPAGAADQLPRSYRDG
jgi:hypothetical protein